MNAVMPNSVAWPTIPSNIVQASRYAFLADPSLSVLILVADSRVWLIERDSICWQPRPVAAWECTSDEDSLEPACDGY